ncbi:hypothetical protein ACFSX6_21315, partial [Hymenobacter rubripertinctus]
QPATTPGLKGHWSPLAATGGGSAVAGPSAALLQRWLRPHWEAPVTDPAQRRFRQSLHETLTDLQLQELALANGYVTLAGVHTALYEQLRALLSTTAVQQYVLDYGYPLLWQLAQRVGLADELAGRDPALRPMLAAVPDQPPLAPGNQVRFASFLSLYGQWQQDSALQAFQQLLAEPEQSAGQSPPTEQALRGLLRRVPADWLRTLSLLPESGPAGEPAGPADTALALQAASGLVRFVEGLANAWQLFAGTDRTGLAAFLARPVGAFFGYHLRGQQALRTGPDWSGEAVAPEVLLYLTTGTVFDPIGAAPETPLPALTAQYQAGLHSLAELWALAQQATGLRLTEP